METWKCDVCAKSFTGLICFQQHEASEKHKKKVQLMNGVTFETPKSAVFETLKPVNPDSINQLHCSICMVSISGLDNYQKHVNSLDHAIMIQKKSGDLLSQAVSNTFELKGEQNQLRESTVSLTNPITTLGSFAECKPCQKQFSRPEPYQQHLASAGHIKKCGLSNQIMRNDETDSKSGDLLSQAVPNTFELKGKQNQLRDSTVSLTNPITTLRSYAECKPCQKQFSGPEPYQQHLASAGHIKKCGLSNEIMRNDETDSKIGNAKINNNLHNDTQSSVSACNLDDKLVSQPFARCDICQMQFSGALPYQLHLVSDNHKEKASNQLPGSLFAGSQIAYKCDICVMTFTGPVPYEQHLMSNGHKKKMNANELSKHLATTGSSSSLDSTLKTNYISLQQCSMNGQKWYCTICKKQCSGAIPYNSHLLSQGHAKNVRIQQVEENLKKIKGVSTFSSIDDKIRPCSSNEVTSTVDLNTEFKKEIKELSIEYKINDLNINVKTNDSKVLSDKFDMNANEFALLNLNIIPPEKLDVTVFGPEDEIVFCSPKKCRQVFLSEMDETKSMCNTEDVLQNNFNSLMVE